MSYHRSIARRARTRTPALAGNFVEDALALVTKDETGACKATADAQTAASEAKASDLNRTWNPTGFYTRDQISQLVQHTLAMLRNATSSIDAAIADPQAPGSRDALKMSLSSLQRKFDESQAFVQANQQAAAQGIQTLDAPGLKRWIVSSMQEANAGIWGVAFIACMRPWWVSALATFQGAFDVVYGTAKKIVGVAVQLGEEILKIPDTVSTMWTYAKWAAAIGGAWWLYAHGPAALKSLKGA